MFVKVRRTLMISKNRLINLCKIQTETKQNCTRNMHYQALVPCDSNQKDNITY